MILTLVSEAQTAGARLHKACEVIGVSARALERWRRQPDSDDRRHGPRRQANNALTPAEQARVLTLMTGLSYAGLSPKQLVPRLADEGVYLASESTMYRLQRRFGLRASGRPPARSHVTRAATAHCATGPNQVWSWDITYLPTKVRGRFLYLYLVLDVWSRRIVGWQVHERENPKLASEMIQHICEDQKIDPSGLVLHSDNGKAMRGSTMVATLQWLGIVPSFSRPHVSDDNPYSEALFRTLKHGPSYPNFPFTSLDAARRWVARFTDWYNREHRHSAIRFVTPHERHFGFEHAVLDRRRALYERARRKKPQRWSGPARNWTPVGAVVLNPEPTIAPATAPDAVRLNPELDLETSANVTPGSRRRRPLHTRGSIALVSGTSQRDESNVLPPTPRPGAFPATPSSCTSARRINFPRQQS
jgi:putative transposase